MPMMNWSASCVKVRIRMKIAPITTIRVTAPVGADVRGSTRAIGLGKRPSSAAAKKIRGAVIIDPFSVPKVLTAIAADTTTTPAGPDHRHRDRRRAVPRRQPRVPVPDPDSGDEVQHDDGR